LETRATLKEIKNRQRELVKRYHPDSGNCNDAEMIRKVNVALLDYVSAYRFSFAEDDFYEQNPEERIWMQFADDPLWGP
jgi:curved DNA-binding protein CbpA